MSKRQRLTARQPVLLTPDMKSKLDSEAARRVMSAGAIMREALRLLFEQWATIDRRGRGIE